MIPPFAETTGGVTQSYATTPPECPKAGHWSSTIELTWSDGSVDDVVPTQPCTRKRR